MSYDQPKLTDAVKPQDAMAVVITALGIAIAIFLPDAIIKLIGVSIAVLGGVALYITLRQRISDTVALKQRRTTLPPPAFKTRVSTDPATSTTRIRFDDFQESFAGDEDDDQGPAPAEAGAVVSSASRVEPSPGVASQSAPLDVYRFVDTDNVDDTLDSSDDSGVAGEEGFRVIRQAPARSAPPREPVAQGATGSTKSRSVEPAAQRVQGKSVEESPARAGASRVEPVERATRPLEPAAEGRTTMRRTPALDLEELIYPESESEGIANEPRGEFVRLVGQVLRAVGRSIEARSIVFFWINFEKEHLIPEAHVTSGETPLRTGARIPLGNDIVSQIARSQTAEIITDISFMSERELIIYYTSGCATRSFVGVPVFYRREVVGVLAADSADENAFNEGAVATLAEYTRLIAGLIRSYTEKYDLHLIARTLDAFESMSRDFSGAEPTPEHVAHALTARIAELFDHRYVAAVLFDAQRSEWRIASWKGESGLPAMVGLRVDVRASLVGQATRNADEVLVQGVLDQPRFFNDERLLDRGTFLALPLVGTTKCYGALAIEHALPEAYIPRDVELMRDLVRYAAMAVEVFNTNRAIEAHTLVDETTGLFNTDYLLSALDREVSRARDFRAPVSLALIAIDLPASLQAERSLEVEEVITASVGAMLQESIRPYDTVGRFDGGRLGVVLAARGDQDAYLWGEKFRKEVASRIIAIGARKSAVTVSIGICDLGDLNGREAMVDGALQALERACAGEGNAVILY